MRFLPVAVVVVLLIVAVPATASASPSQFTMFEAPRELLSDDAALRTRTFDEVDRMGVHWLRVVVYWHSVAPDADAASVPAFDERDPAAYPGFGPYDRLMQEARARRLRVLLTVSGPVPRWATQFKEDTVSRPSPTRFGRFMEAVIRRYGAQVGHWAIWNEPNHPEFLGPQYGGQGSRRRALSPGIYRHLFQAAERAFAKVGSRSDRVLAGETAPIGTRRVVAPLTFLRGALCLDSSYRKRRACAALRADGWAHHAYTTKAGPRYRPPGSDNVTIGALSRLTSALTRAGRAKAIRSDAPIYLTEFGIQSTPDTASGVSEARQNEFRAMSEQVAYRNPRVAAFSQYLMRDDPPRTTGPARERYGGFESGLRHSDGDPKLSYAGFPVPVVATRGRTRTTLWGLVRPAQGRTRVTIEYRPTRSSRWRRLKTESTDPRGVWTTTTAAAARREYRARWRAPNGIAYAGPAVRSYR